ncbi:MAG: hypothetical protein EKK46_02985 [Rhodocyclaceae bacterium]|nr:MAG: hypothetical protein EKK46_02985 [Rhodocyclaceae bacterium]
MIEAALLSQVADAVAALPSLADENGVTQTLRGQFPGLKVVVCSDEHIPPRVKPVAENTVCHLYYMDTGEHCVKFTGEAEAASGIVVGLIGDDA